MHRPVQKAIDNEKWFVFVSHDYKYIQNSVFLGGNKAQFFMCFDALNTRPHKKRAKLQKKTHIDK